MQKRPLTAFGIEVKKRLVELGKTQKELAEILGINQVYLNIILHGKRSGKKYIDTIAQYLNINLPTLKAS